MKERPILFSAPMVRALLAGTKTQTRRIVKPQPDSTHSGFPYWSVGGYRTSWCRSAADGGPLVPANPLLCPYGQPGDRLWVRETFARIDGQTHPWIETDYRATYTHGDRLGDSLGIKKRWSPAIHMPRHASRILLDVKAVRVERLQDISDDDLAAEGIQELIDGGVDHDGTPRDTYRALWEQLNGNGSWAANPWVWVVEFERAQAQQKGQTP